MSTTRRSPPQRHWSTPWRTSSSWWQGWLAGRTSPDFNAVSSPVQRPARTPKHVNAHNGLRSLQRCSCVVLLRWENSCGSAGQCPALRCRSTSLDPPLTVGAVRCFLNLSALNHDLGYPTEQVQCTCYLQARQSEPGTRNALPGAHTAMAFTEEVAERPSSCWAHRLAAPFCHTERASRKHHAVETFKTGPQNAHSDAVQDGSNRG